MNTPSMANFEHQFDVNQLVKLKHLTINSCYLVQAICNISLKPKKLLSYFLPIATFLFVKGKHYLHFFKNVLMTEREDTDLLFHRTDLCIHLLLLLCALARDRTHRLGVSRGH